MLRNRPFNLDNSFIKLFARCANLIILHIPAIFHLKPVTYTGNWFRLPLSNTSQAGWRLRWRGWFLWILRFRWWQAGTLGLVVRWWALTEGYNYTQCSQGNLLFFQHKSQEDKDLQEREGRFFAVSFSEKSSLPLPKWIQWSVLLVSSFCLF